MTKLVLSVYYQNCRGLRTKLHTLYMQILSHNYDVIILTETWLHCNITDNELFDFRYRVFRCDRDRISTGRKDGGGVLVAVRSDLCATQCVCAHDNCEDDSAQFSLIDHVLIEIHSHKYRCIISAVYIPPKMNPNVYMSHFNNLSSMLQAEDINDYIIAGDYNLPTLEWRQHENYLEPIFNNNCSTSDKLLINFMSGLTGFQINKYKNTKDRLLDILITNINNSSTVRAHLPLVPPDDNHPPFFALLPINDSLSSINTKSRIEYNFRKGNYEMINNDILNTDWNMLFSKCNIETAIHIFYDIIYKLIKVHIPTRTIKSTQFPIWFTKSLIHIFKNKNSAWIRWKKFKNCSDYVTFSMYRARFKKESKKCYKTYMETVEIGIKDNVKYFWKYVNNMKVNAQIPSTVSYKNEMAKTPDEVCRLFSSFFESVFELSDLTNDYDEKMLRDTNQFSNAILSNITLNVEDVHRELRNLDAHKGSGVDNIPPIFLKSTAKTLCHPLLYLFNKCLKDGVFPTIWKAARIVPVFKSGDRSLVANYRPISILCTLSKLFERLVHNNIYPRLHNVIIEQQHGFVKRRSTSTNLLIYVSNLFECIDANKRVDSVYTDFQKCFDRVDHKILLDKLAYNGIRGDLWRWFKAYITNRTQKVVINGYESDYVAISSGVPQGSILGPLLFILFINDINNCFQFCDFLLYADDLKIYHTVENDDDYQQFQSDLDRFSLYCIHNKLNLSINKCKTITFTKKRQITEYNYSLSGLELESVQSIRDLGVILDSKMNLDIHIYNIITNAFRMYGLVMRLCKNFKNTSTFLYLYKSLIRPQIEYAVPIWNPYYSKYNDALEKVQKKFLRCLQYKCASGTLPYQELLNKYNLLSLRHRRLQLETTVLYDLCHNRYDCISIINKLYYRVPTRSHSRASCKPFAIPRYRTNSGKRSPLLRLMHSYNELFHSVDIATRPSVFKKLILNKINQLR
jgi:hypothetical protein